MKRKVVLSKSQNPRSTKSSIFYYLLAVSLPILLANCIPSFQGFKPVTPGDFKAGDPTAPAEILYIKSDTWERYLQVGDSRRKNFWRYYERIRINNRKGFKFATKKFSAKNISALKVTTRCKDGESKTLDLDKFLQISLQKRDTPLISMKKRGMSNLITVTALGVKPGCIVDFFWEVDTSAPVSGWAIFKKIPLREAEYSFYYRSGKTYRAFISNLEVAWFLLSSAKKGGGKGVAQMENLPGFAFAGLFAGPKAEKSSREKFQLTEKEKQYHISLEDNPDQRRIVLKLKNIPALRSRKVLKKMAAKNLLPPYYTVPPKCKIVMTRTYGMSGRELATSWAAIQKSYLSRYSADEELELEDNAITRDAKAIAAKAAGRNGKIWALYNHLRRKRTKTKNATGSPYKLEKVYQLGRGNSYEINMIFVVMLRSVGIKAYPALVAPATSNYFHLPPHDGHFETVATYIPSASEGKWMGLSREKARAKSLARKAGNDPVEVTSGKLVDPSEKFLSYGIMPREYWHSWGFILDGVGNRFYKIPAPTSGTNQKSARISVEYKSDGSATGQVNITLKGYCAYKARKALSELSLPDQLGRWEKWASALCRGKVTFELTKKPNIQGDPREPLSLTYLFKGKNCFAKGGPSSISSAVLPLRGSILNSDRPLNLPLYLPFPANKNQIEIKLKFEKEFSVKPEKVELSAPNMSFKFRKGTAGGKFSLYITLEIEKDTIPEKGSTAVKKFLTQVRKALKRALKVER